jgi:DNA phosphorothioation-associated putative methyltransferase
MKVNRQLTAIARTDLSRPFQLAIEHQVISKRTRILDFGCGRGFDVDKLRDSGWSTFGWDPAHRPTTRKTKSDVVTFNYVLNVIEDQNERVLTLKSAFELAKSCLIVSARLDFERDEAHVRPFADGWLTSRNTFQKFYTQDELRDFLQSNLNVEPQAAAPGIFYLFKTKVDLERFRSTKYRIRTPKNWIRKSDELYKDNFHTLEPLIEFVHEHGRIPKPLEMIDTEQLLEKFGSLKMAFRVVQNVTDNQEWKHVSQRCKISLLVTLAMRKFDGDYRFSDLDYSLQNDVKTFYGSLKAASVLAERLLFAVGKMDAINIASRSSTVGKLTPTALYVHTNYLHRVPAVLQIYEACARKITGDIPNANIIKFHRDVAMISYLSYPDFWNDPHPQLNTSYAVSLTDMRIKVTNYAKRSNPPILHRKETFLHESDPNWELFRNLSIDETAAGLYANTAIIGTKEPWESLLVSKKLSITDHKLLPR